MQQAIAWGGAEFLRWSVAAAPAAAAAPGRVLAEVADDPFVQEADLSVRETYRAELWSKRFMGLQGGHLCATFGFDRNSYPEAALQVLVAFFCLKVLVAIAYCCRGPPPDPFEEVEPESVVALEEPALEELSRFGDLVDEHLGEGSRIGSLALQATKAASLAAQPEAQPGLPEGPGGPGPWSADVEQLRAEVQERLAGLREKWAKEKLAPLAVPGQVKVVEESNSQEAWLIVTYLRLQGILSCIVLVSICSSASTTPKDHNAWSFYCLFVYAFANSGLLPSGVMGLAYLLASASNPLFLVPNAMDLSGRSADSSYQPLPTGSAGPPLTMVVRMSTTEAQQARWHVLLCVMPSLLPLVCIAITHVLPFTILYMWVAVIAALLLFFATRLAQLIDPCLLWFSQFSAVAYFLPQQRAARQAELAVLFLQVATTVFVIMSVMTMTRVYAGEYLHGGYLDQLLEHLIRDRKIWGKTTCPWGNANRFIDALLRWT